MCKTAYRSYYITTFRNDQGLQGHISLNLGKILSFPSAKLSPDVFLHAKTGRTFFVLPASILRSTVALLAFAVAVTIAVYFVIAVAVRMFAVD